MTNADKNKAFLSKVDARIAEEVLANIAAHYRITVSAVIAELEDDEAEHFLDYVTGPRRSAFSALARGLGVGV